MHFPAPTRLFAAILLLSAAPALAGPAASPGDIGLRHDIQVLADYGVVRGPVTAWPLSWDAIHADLRAARDAEMVLPVAVDQLLSRMLVRAERETTRNRPRFKARLSGAEKPTAVRGFSNTPREDAAVSAGFAVFGEHVSLDLNVTGVDDPLDEEDVRADGSRLSVDLGNLTIGASTLERWWGPGWDGSLILSNNARPIPSLMMTRNRTDAFETKWLSWIGPWDFHLLFGQFDDPRFIDDARFFGLRVTFKPHPSFEIGLSRTAQWCGETRPCGLDVFWDIFIGKDNLGDQGVTFETEPSNQLAGFDLRWSNQWFGQPSAIYAQMIGDDEAGGLPSLYMGLGGLETSGFIRNRWSWRAFVEYAATSCDVFSENRFNCAYNHSIYETGYRYYGRAIGHGADNDARLISAGYVMTSSEGSTLELLLRTGELNRGGAADPRHTLTPTPLDIDSIDLRYGRDTKIGRLELGIGHEQLDDPSTGTSTSDTRGFLTWRSR